MPRPDPTRRAALAAGATAGLLAASALVTAPAPAAADTPTPAAAGAPVVIEGGGWGHGRGLGQWGSLGYAIGDYGNGPVNPPWSSAQILDHFYGGTTAGTTSPTQPISVDIQSQSGQVLAVQADAGAVTAATPAGTAITSAAAVRVQRSGSSWSISTAATCAGPWTPATTRTDTYIRLLAPTSVPSTFAYGTTGDIPVTGDWNGDGTDTAAVFRPATATWYVRAANGTTASQFAFGTAGDLPVAGDWDGDGIDGIGVFRPSDGTFHLSQLAGPGSATTYSGFGAGTPVAGDWDGDGDDGVGLVQMPVWQLWDDPGNAAAVTSFNYGLATDAPVVGDWDGDGDDTQGIRRGAEWHLRNTLGSGGASTTFTALSSGGTPLAGRWSGTAADAVGRHSGNAWELQITASDLDRTLQLCHGGGFGGSGPVRSSSPTDTRYYRGELRALVHNGQVRTSNVVALDEYLRGVVPRESPAYWGGLGTCTAGRCTGMSQLEAQSVAARSYALGENRFGTWGSQTCDTTSCQVYGGRARRTSGGVEVLEHPNTDRAITATSGVIRRTPGGSPSRTEFSSSTGGRTAGGQFTAVDDLGDGIAGNSNHAWQVTLQPSQLLAALGLSGTLNSVAVTSRTPADGGFRAAVVTITTSFGTYTRTGDQFRLALGLRSTLFTVSFGADTVPSPGPGVGLLVRRSNIFHVRFSATPGPADRSFSFGASTDTPLVGDWNGDGRTDVGVWRAGTFYLRTALSSGPPTHQFTFGRATDVPVVGDWNGDGRTDVGVVRGTTWHLRTQLAGGNADISFAYGAAGDVPVAGDWDGDGKAGPGVLRGSTFHLRDPLSGGPAQASVTLVGPVAQAVTSDWDGDGRTEVGRYDGTFTLLASNATGSAAREITYGAPGDHGAVGRFSP